MPKYRTLTLEEVQSLEKEFIDFLVVNGIPADDWEKIKANDKDQANGIIDSFSDVVFEKILRSNKYLVRRSETELAAVVCLSEKFHMIAIKYNNNQDIEEAYTSEKAFIKDRESEIWDLMTKQGFELSDGKEYLSLVDKL